MLTTDPQSLRSKEQNRPEDLEDLDFDQAEADADLADVFGGEGDVTPHFRSKWFVGGIWPFRRISFECPGCSRWLSANSSHSGRIGFCPSCDLTLSVPDVAADLPAALVSTAKKFPALPARRLPERREAAPADPDAKTADSRSGHAPELTRFGATAEEEDWGYREDGSMVPLRVVTSFQTVAPWVGLVALLVAAGFIGRAFMGMQVEEDAAPIPSIHPPKPAPAPQHGSDLWVVLDALATAETPEELSSLVRNPTEMLPKMQAFYSARPEIKLPHRFERARPGLKIYKMGERRIGRFEGRCDGRPVMFSFESTPNGWRLDWESLLGYSEGDWSSFVAERPAKEQEFRLVAKISTDDLIEYNRERFVCMHMTDHFETRTAFVLVDKNSAAATKLAKFFNQHAAGNSPRTWIRPVLKPSEHNDQLFDLVDVTSSWLAL